MFTKVTKIAAPLALAAGIAFATPAAASFYSPFQMRVEIGQLHQQVERIGQSNRFTNSEYRRMQNAVDLLEDTYRSYGRDGFDRREVAGLSERIDNVRARINTQARDGDRLNRR